MWYFLTVMWDGAQTEDSAPNSPINLMGFGPSIYPMNNGRQKIL